MWVPSHTDDLKMQPSWASGGGRMPQGIATTGNTYVDKLCTDEINKQIAHLEDLELRYQQNMEPRTTHPTRASKMRKTLRNRIAHEYQNTARQ